MGRSGSAGASEKVVVENGVEVVRPDERIVFRAAFGELVASLVGRHQPDPFAAVVELPALDLVRFDPELVGERLAALLLKIFLFALAAPARLELRSVGVVEPRTVPLSRPDAAAVTHDRCCSLRIKKHPSGTEPATPPRWSNVARARGSRDRYRTVLCYGLYVYSAHRRSHVMRFSEIV